jgi:hypothetical protein
VTPSRWVPVAVVLLLAVPAAAQDTDAPKGKSYRIFGQSTTYIEYNQTNQDGDYTKFKQLVSFNIEWSKFTIGARAEYLYYSDPELVHPGDLDKLYEGLNLRQYFIDYQTDKFNGRLGTFFASHGRGLTLYVQKNETLKFDEPIHGGIAMVTLKHFDFSVLGGRVSEPVLQNQYGREFEDEVAGARAVARLPLDLYVGGSYVRAKLDRFFPEGTDDVDVWSIEAGGNNLGGVVDLYAEWADIEKTERGIFKEGHGRYYSASAYIGPLNILAEYKDYYNFAYRYNLPPNAGRVNEAYNHNDVKGPRLLISADILSTSTLLHGSYATFNTHKTSTSPGGTQGDEQVEWYAGIEQWIGRVYFEGSYFDRNWTDRKIKEEHTLADFHVTVGQSGEIILGYDKRLEKASYFSLGTTRTHLTYSLSPWGSVSLRYSWEDRDGSDTEDFWGAEVQYLPKPSLILTVFGGADPGGLICAGGQCRIEPEFKGFKANFTWRF